MDIRKFSSNSSEFKEHLLDTKKAPNIDTVENEKEVIKTLGLLYLPIPDVHSFHYHLEEPKEWTLAAAISIMSKIFGPTGKTAPFQLVTKIIFRRVWSSMQKPITNLIWQRIIHPDHIKLIKIWINQVPELKRIVFTRCFEANQYVGQTIGQFNPYFKGDRLLCTHNLMNFDCECSDSWSVIVETDFDIDLEDVKEPIEIPNEKYENYEVEKDFEDDSILKNEINECNPFKNPWKMGTEYGFAFTDRYRNETDKPEIVTAKSIDVEDLNIDLGETAKEFWNNIKQSKSTLTLQRNDHIREMHFSDKFGVLSSSVHTFVDASKEGYAATAYMVTHYFGINQTVRQIFSKAKLSPKNVKTIPRLDLISAGMGIEIAQKMVKAFGIKKERIIYWTDSSAVLGWINATKSLKTFVQNRIKKILQFSNPGQWYHVPGIMNPADIGSRGEIYVDKILSDKKWLHGPKFLFFPPAMWPKEPQDCILDKQYLEDYKSEFLPNKLNILIHDVKKHPNEYCYSIIGITSLDQMMLIARVIYIWKERSKQKSSIQDKLSSLEINRRQLRKLKEEKKFYWKNMKRNFSIHHKISAESLPTYHNDLIRNFKLPRVTSHIYNELFNRILIHNQWEFRKQSEENEKKN